MKEKILLSIFILSNLIVCGQKNYRIGNIIWKYEEPLNYYYRIDNCSEIIEKKSKYIAENSSDINIQANDVILFVSAKSESSNWNAIFATYRDDKIIKKYTFKGYIEKLVEFMKTKYDELGTKHHILIEESKIDTINFYLIKNTILDDKNAFLYETLMFYADISGAELTISLYYNNETDKKLLLDSIYKSKFENNK